MRSNRSPRPGIASGLRPLAMTGLTEHKEQEYLLNKAGAAPMPPASGVGARPANPEILRRYPRLPCMPGPPSGPSRPMPPSNIPALFWLRIVSACAWVSTPSCTAAELMLKAQTQAVRVACVTGT